MKQRLSFTQKDELIHIKTEAMENLKEFNELIERYETITLEEIRTASRVYCSDPHDYIVNDHVMKALTGFGSSKTCTLCYVRVSYLCSGCVYASYSDCNNLPCTDHETYRMISYAKTADELLAAYRARAEYMNRIKKEL